MPTLPRLKNAAALALALTGTAVCAGPASAESLDTYQATFSGTLTHNRTGHDTSIQGVDWRRETALKANFTSKSAGLDFMPESGVVPAPAPMTTTSVTGTDVEDTITLTVDGSPQWSSCVNDGQGFASPGQISFRKLKGADGEQWVEATVRPFNTFQVHASCSGFSSATGIFDWSSAPPEDKVRFKLSSIGKTDEIITHFRKSAPCPVTAETEATVSCTTVWDGQFRFTRIGMLETLDPPKKKPAKALGGKAGSVVGRVDRGLKKGSVTAACPTGCTGKISAYAVAIAKKKGKRVKESVAKRPARPILLGKGTIRSPRGGGVAKGSVAFDKKDRKAIRKRGGIEYRIRITPTGGKPYTKKIVVRAAR